MGIGWGREEAPEKSLHSKFQWSLEPKSEQVILMQGGAVVGAPTAKMMNGYLPCTCSASFWDLQL